MESMRSTWTDSRLDDFVERTEKRFDVVDRRFDAVDRRFDRVEKAIGEVHAEVIGVRNEAHALQRTIIGAGGAMSAALLGVIATQI